MRREVDLDGIDTDARTVEPGIQVKRPRGRPRKGTPAVPKPPKREPGYGRLQQLLRDDILEGRIPAGSRIKVSEIAARYATSTNPAREALQGLEGEGLVIISPNRGARVRAIDEDFIRNIFDIRDLIEPYLVRGFAEFASNEDVAALEALQQTCQSAVDAADYPAYHRANVAFHDLMIEHHHNVEAATLMKRHSAWIRALSRRNPLTLANMRRSTAEHWEVVEAVRRGDPDAASAAMARHISHSRALFLGRMRRDRAQR
ncbi:GntR family transcriptional regulator [Mycobacterium sp. KBS0706]|nr:GntR family transcriptional regulator [Mycobacterium sp. KBS0706]